MKKIFTLLIGIVFSITILNAQDAPPQAFSFQAIITGTNGQPVVNRRISLRISIIQDNTNGYTVYSESFNPITDRNAQVNVSIGKGNVLSGIFSAIDWSAHKFFLKVEVDARGGTNYQMISNTQLLSVPYALYAKSTDYNYLINKPILFDGTWTSLTGKPTFATVATSGDYKDLLNKPTLFDGTWASLTGKPTTIGGYGITDAVTTTGNQMILGNKMFSNDLSINGLTIGLGAGAVFHNTVIGFQALNANTTGAQNTVIGFEALYYNTTGGNNTVNGYGTMFKNTIGSYNAAYGYDALYSNMSGNFNASYGSFALGNNTAGNYNTAIGEHALFLNTTGENNTSIGYNAGYSNNGKNNVFLGSSAGYYETGSNKLFIDNQERTNESDARNKALIYGVFDANPANQDLTINGTLSMQNRNITNLADPVNTKDAATKAYVDASSGGATTHSVGEGYGGGIVFYVYDDRHHGLIAATADQGIGIRWYAGTYTFTMALADGVGAGKANTATIIANQGYGDGTTYAARICNEYSVTGTDGVTYGDWYLPSKFELNLLYLQKSVVGGFANDAYWSSTESNNYSAWVQGLTTGTQYDGATKNYLGCVRAVRAF